MLPLITLIPNSGIQFYDVDLDEALLARQGARTFWEEPLGGPPDPGGATRVKLHELKPDKDTSQLVEPLSGNPPPDHKTYPISARHAFDMHLDRWVPLPYFMLTSRSGAGEEAYGHGPSNWARARLVRHPLPAPGRTHRLTLAFDTALLARGTEHYVAPSPADSACQQEFAFVADSMANAWFLNETWVGNWLREMLVGTLTAARGGRPLRPEDLERGCQHYARYQVMLGLLAAAEVLPRVLLLNEESAYNPAVNVDLVLDLGNARTCGILIEEHSGQGMNLSDSYPLALRDLSQPESLDARPFDSRVEFALAAFGPDSRESGRAAAFDWPSRVRVGAEAARLAGARLGNEGLTGLSSPKRYLWDTRPATQSWRFTGSASDGAKGGKPVSGSFMTLVTDDGSVLRQQRAGRPASRALFSRSNVFTFMLAEILLQALGQMNAPGSRMQRRDANKPRRLRALLMTMPPGMPVAEQHILRARAKGAVLLAWDMLGWTDKIAPARVVANLDEATATQIVWLHNEVTERLQGDAGALLELVGRVRPRIVDGLAPGAVGVEVNAPSLRIASIDIGGGTTDLMISTYTTQGEAILPYQEFRESFKIAGDDVLERVITAVALPAFERALREAGVADPRALLNRALGQDQGGQSEPERHWRRLFVSTVLEPVGIAILRAYEAIKGRTVDEVLHRTVGDILGTALAASGRALGYLEQAASADARGFRVADVVIAVTTQQIEPVVVAVLGPVLADLCEVVWTYDCDVLLLSGRPSRLRVVGDIVLAKAPVAPHRIIGMHRYQVGEKYPFRDASNRIDDPKTTVAVGAALCVQAEGRLRNFMLRAGKLSMRSTARYIGKMDNNGQIRQENVLFSNPDLDGPPTPDVTFKLQFQTVTQLGFRQLPIARWTATPLYLMEFANPDNAHKMDLPLTVTVARREIDPESPDAEAQREMFTAVEVVDASDGTQRNDIVRLRLQTLDDQDGYWRDTGRLVLP
jgi:hypothetical protein